LEESPKRIGTFADAVAHSGTFTAFEKMVLICLLHGDVKPLEGADFPFLALVSFSAEPFFCVCNPCCKLAVLVECLPASRLPIEFSQ
jgi:hypothetical protein